MVVALHREDDEDDAAEEERSMQCRPLKFLDRDGTAAAELAWALTALTAMSLRAVPMHGAQCKAVAIPNAIASKLAAQLWTLQEFLRSSALYAELWWMRVRKHGNMEQGKGRKSGTVLEMDWQIETVGSFGSK
jgi:hypothetical protein